MHGRQAIAVGYRVAATVETKWESAECDVRVRSAYEAGGGGCGSDNKDCCFGELMAIFDRGKGCCLVIFTDFVFLGLEIGEGFRQG